MKQCIEILNYSRIGQTPKQLMSHEKLLIWILNKHPHLKCSFSKLSIMRESLQIKFNCYFMYCMVKGQFWLS